MAAEEKDQNTTEAPKDDQKPETTEAEGAAEQDDDDEDSGLAVEAPNVKDIERAKAIGLSAEQIQRYSGSRTALLNATLEAAIARELDNLQSGEKEAEEDWKNPLSEAEDADESVKKAFESLKQYADSGRKKDRDSLLQRIERLEQVAQQVTTKTDQQTQTQAQQAFTKWLSSQEDGDMKTTLKKGFETKRGSQWNKFLEVVGGINSERFAAEEIFEIAARKVFPSRTNGKVNGTTGAKTGTRNTTPIRSGSDKDKETAGLVSQRDRADAILERHLARRKV